MPKIPFTIDKDTAIDDIGLRTDGAAIIDGYVDSLGNVNKRPGFLQICDLGTGAPVDGIFWWNRLRNAVAVSGGRIFKIKSTSGLYEEITGDALSKNSKVSFAPAVLSNESPALFAANGGKIVHIPIGGEAAYLSDTDAPTKVSHVAYVKRHLIANSVNSDIFHISDIDDPVSFSGSYFSAPNRPDHISALGVSDLEVYVIGDNSLETWYYDGSTPFVSDDQAFIQSGTKASQSFRLCGDTWFWLNSDSSLVRMDGRTAQSLSIALTKYINMLSGIEHAEAEYLVVNGRRYYILQFKNEGTTIVYDIDRNTWTEWCYWNATKAEYESWLGNCCCHSPVWGVSLVGDRRTGKIYLIDDKYVDDAGDVIRTMVRTPQINWGTSAVRKRSNNITFRFKKTQKVSTVSTPEVLFRWRDNGNTVWKNWRTLTLDPIGKLEFKKMTKRLGSYRSRQYELVMLDDTPLALVSAEENMKILGS